MIISVTGHRPDKLGGYRTPNPVYNAVMESLDKALIELSPSKVITGMALGIDQWVAELCIMNDIPFVAAIPFAGQDSKWPPQSQARYRWLCGKAVEQHIVSLGEYGPHKLQIRNQWMVDHSDLLLAFWNGTSGGTANCVGYAQQKGKPIHFVTLPPVVANYRPQIAERVNRDAAPPPTNPNNQPPALRPQRRPVPENENFRFQRAVDLDD